MTANLLHCFWLILAAGSILGMEEAQDQVQSIDKAKAFYEIFDNNGNRILHSSKKMTFRHVYEKNTKGAVVIFFNKAGKQLGSEEHASDNFCLCTNEHTAECNALSNYQSSLLCKTIESKLDPLTKPTARSIGVSYDNDFINVIFFADESHDETIASQKFNFSELVGAEGTIEQIKYFINMDKGTEDSIIKHLSEDSDESNSSDECVIS